MSNNLEQKKLHAEQLVAIFYGDGTTPPEAFLSDLDLLINGKISNDDMRERILARYKQEAN